MGKTTLLIEFVIELQHRPWIILCFLSNQRKWNSSAFDEKILSKLMEKKSSDNINLGSDSVLRMEFLNKLFEIADNDVIFGICFAANENFMTKLQKMFQNSHKLVNTLLKVNILYIYSNNS
jgi:hypothetical protein